MKTEIIRSPVKALIFRNMFSEKVNEAILKESIFLEKNFISGMTSKGLDLNYRNNLVCYYDEIFVNNRNNSILLTTINELFSNNSQFRETIVSFGYPFFKYIKTNTHETQVSNYGRDNEKYDYHIDMIGKNKLRIITFVYYFFKEPKKFKGGEIEFTNSPIVNGNLVEENADTLIIKPENNMGIIFDSSVPHFVHPTSSNNFNEGRFSVNCWLGIDEKKARKQQLEQEQKEKELTKLI